MTDPYVFDEAAPYRHAAMRDYDAASKVRRVMGRASASSDIHDPNLLADGALDPCYLEDPIPTRRKNRHPPLVRVLTR